MPAESSKAELIAMLILLASLLMLLYEVDHTHCLLELEQVPGNETDKLALLDFKTLDPKGALTSWNTTTPYCQWSGVSCSRRPNHLGRVTALDLSGHGLSGPIPASLANLTFLVELKMSANYFSGGLPPLNRLRRLQILDLKNNLLQSTISDAITNLPPDNLEAIDLSKNLITGQIPPSLGLLFHKLIAVELANNALTGSIPSNLTNASQLGLLNLAYNHLTGSVPSELGQLSSMEAILLGGNMLSGGMPGTLFNMSSLQILDVAANMLGGGLEFPPPYYKLLPSLSELHMFHNLFEGGIPPALGNASNLKELDLSQNNFTGRIPASLGNLRALTYLNLGENSLQARDKQSWEFIDKLSQYRSLEELHLDANDLQGAIPDTIGNLSTTLTQLVLQANHLSGAIPTSIGNLSSLITLELASNNLNGTVGEWCGRLKNLQRLSLESNSLTGPIPSSIGDLTRLSSLTLGENRFEGPIPPSLGNLPTLSELNLSYNSLDGSIPKQMFRSGSSMVTCVLSHNDLQGPIPQEIGNLGQVTDLELSSNNLTGEIPRALGSCVGLLVLRMDRNFLTGNISVLSLGDLKSLSTLNLSHNNLSGSIPIYLSQLQHLTQLDLSYNNLQGDVPTAGVFGNASSVSLVGNPGLCGGVSDLHMHACPTAVSRGRQRRYYYLIKILIPIFGFMSLVALCYFCITEMKDKRAHSASPPFGDKFLKVSYNDLAEATKSFSESNLIGRGSYGSVYRGNLMQDSTKLEVAVKVLDLDMRGAEKSFLSECEALGSIQHRNIVPIITACSTVQAGGEFKALVYGYMPNGNLDTWLHRKVDGGAAGPKHLSLAQRICVAVNIADALDYIHNDSGKPIVHCDVKPSNVLLDDDMNARLGDFGIASFYRITTTTGRDAYSTTSLGVKGTIGYIAPEYAGGGRPSTCGDVYSFGVLLLEMLTGKRPTDPMFENGLSITNFVERSFPDEILQVIDASLKDECKPASTTVHQCLLCLVEVALSCTRQFPSERMTMREAASRISAIKASHVKGKDRAASLQHT